jgi:phosphoglycolate phosphatase
MPIRGLIFDLDGTLVDSRLDFDAMRREMGIPAGAGLFEAIGRMPPDEAERCRKILHDHEQAGALRATLMPGVREFLDHLAARRIPCAGLTRNSRSAALLTTERLNLALAPLITREDAPLKPDPTAVYRICEHWGFQPSEVAVVGDYHYDIDVGRNAGAWSVLYLGGRRAEELEYASRAHRTLDCFTAPHELLAWLEGA